MARSTAEILRDIDEFQPPEDQWLPLEDLLGELWNDGRPAEGIDVLLKVFERFPDHDGYGVFWSIVHGLESVGSYEKKLVESVRRLPTEFSIQMVNRLIRSGEMEVDGLSLLALLEEVAGDDTVSEDARDWAEAFLEEHRQA